MTEGAQNAGLQVNPAALQTFATNLGAEAGELAGLGAGTAFSTAVGALPGTDFGAVAQQSADVVNRCLARMGERLTTVADSMRTAAGSYEMAEADFTRALTTIGLQLP
ncbi:ESX-1 secretion-associated protein [Nocardia farcinica]|uniref:type VII secretion target n=1 Tax=Nocardia farcinica TaxID=37329 RepID=UPI0018936FC0|nr:type VII secretion target [Nocardia farcinica]MBF6375609.1 ESX-1 secretion-associated protein [Nocardia farcinica]MBF6421641.1 ESX-1 secretion-associated protein [Nocardia farcinica]MBF6433298.1 ESX-1 secretion-associated protein [Nocardia farcinica]MBF6504116.1 ESX-1 secretion-associated protein [Nocardia farcinica]